MFNIIWRNELYSSYGGSVGVSRIMYDVAFTNIEVFFNILNVFRSKFVKVYLLIPEVMLHRMLFTVEPVIHVIILLKKRIRSWILEISTNCIFKGQCILNCTTHETNYASASEVCKVKIWILGYRTRESFPSVLWEHYCEFLRSIES